MTPLLTNSNMERNFVFHRNSGDRIGTLFNTRRSSAVSALFLLQSYGGAYGAASAGRDLVYGSSNPVRSRRQEIGTSCGGLNHTQGGSQCHRTLPRKPQAAHTSIKSHIGNILHQKLHLLLTRATCALAFLPIMVHYQNYQKLKGL